MKLNRKERRAMNKKGFSLIELIVVMAVMGILVLIAAPRYLGYTKDANVTAMQADAKTLSNAALQYSIAHDDAWPTTGTDLAAATLADAPAAVDVYDAMQKAFVAAGGTGTFDATAAHVQAFDPAKLSSLIKNTKNPQGDYYLVTSGILTGEVFYKSNLTGSDGKLNNGVFKDIVE